MSLILDSSVTLARVCSSETTPAIVEVFDRLIEGGARVPALWRLEVANALEMRARQRRIEPEFRDAALRNLALLPIRMDPETDRQAWGVTLHLAEKHRLTVYGAAYLELALRRSLPLATLDAELRSAAAIEGVPLLGL